MTPLDALSAIIGRAVVISQRRSVRYALPGSVVGAAPPEQRDALSRLTADDMATLRPDYVFPELARR